MIICAAIKKGNVIYTGKRHSDAIINATSGGKKVQFGPDDIQGFITDHGQFFNRKDAGEHAFLYDQIKEQTDLLMSEDLY